MTVTLLLRTLLRRWYVVVLILAATVFAALAAGRVPGVFWTQVDVVFLPPASYNVLEDHADGIVQFAAIVEREFNGNPGDAVRGLPSGTLYGEGIRDGSEVVLLDSGGQWGTNYNRQVLSVEVVGASETEVTDTVADIGARIAALSIRIQDDAGVAPDARITTFESPAPPVVAYIGGSSRRAQAVILVLGGAVALALSVAVDYLLSRRTGRRQGPTGEGRSPATPRRSRTAAGVGPA
jgi:hypothetical protein